MEYFDIKVYEISKGTYEAARKVASHVGSSEMLKLAEECKKSHKQLQNHSAAAVCKIYDDIAYLNPIIEHEKYRFNHFSESKYYSVASRYVIDSIGIVKPIASPFFEIDEEDTIHPGVFSNSIVLLNETKKTMKTALSASKENLTPLQIMIKTLEDKQTKNLMNYRG